MTTTFAVAAGVVAAAVALAAAPADAGLPRPGVHAVPGVTPTSRASAPVVAVARQKVTKSRKVTLSRSIKTSTVPVQLLAFNDYHGRLGLTQGSDAVLPGLDGQDVGGGAYLAAHLKRLREGRAYSLTLAAGDLVGSAPFLSGMFRDEPSVESLSALGLDVSGVGNHEFDRGVSELLRLQYGGCSPTEGCAGTPAFAGARFSWLAGNVTYRDGVTVTPPAGSSGYGDWFGARTGRTVLPPTAVRTVAGLKIGFIGATLEGTSGLVRPQGVADVTFGDEAAAVNLAAADLRDAGVKAIVVLLHEGGYPPAGAGYDFTCSDSSGISGPVLGIAEQISPSVDLILTGHTHQAYACQVPDPAGNPRWVVSASSFGRMISEVSFPLRRSTGEAVRNQITVVQHPVTRDVTPDADQTALLATWKARAADPTVGGGRRVGTVTSVVRRSTSGATESSLADLLADAQLAATAPDVDGASVAAFVNPSGIRADLGSSQTSPSAVGATASPTTTSPPTTSPTGTIAPNAGSGALAVSYANAYSVQPLNYLVYSMTLTGAQIDAALEQQWRTGNTGVSAQMLGISGLTYTWSASAPVGSKVNPASIRIGGQPLDLQAHYRVTANSFLAGGGDGFTAFTSGTNRITGGVDLQVLRAYLAANPALAAPAAPRSSSTS